MDHELSIITTYAKKGAKIRVEFFQENNKKILEVSRQIAQCLVNGGKILLCGNGGSAADAQHIAAEFVCRFRIERPPLPAIALTTDTSILTAISNDYSFEDLFARQVQAIGNEGDILMGISTSGKSKNVIKALIEAKEKGMITVGLTGKRGGDMEDHCDFIFKVPTENTALIQEVHITIGHLLCRFVDYYLFENAEKLESLINF